MTTGDSHNAQTATIACQIKSQPIHLKEGSVDLARRSGHRAAAAFAERTPPSAEAYRRQRCQVLTRRSARSPTITQLPQSRYIALAIGAVAEGLVIPDLDLIKQVKQGGLSGSLRAIVAEAPIFLL